MRRDAQPPVPPARLERARRLAIWCIIIAVAWAPGVVALAMILTGHLGR